MKKELTTGEQELFDQLDALEFSEAELALNTLTAEPQSAAPSEEELEAISRIKVRTLSRTGTAPDVQRRLPSVRRSRRQAYTGVAAALLLGAGLVFTSPSVQAGLKQVFSFLPGLHTVVENSPDSPLYVLKKPFTAAVGRGELTVNAILVQENRATINLRGQKTRIINEFQADIGGTRYTFMFNSRTSSGGLDWDASYSALLPHDLTLQAEEAVTLYINSTVIGPLVLGPPQTADDLQQLGVSDVQQDVRISAFPVRLGDGLVRVELVPALQKTASAASSYTLEPLMPWNGTYVENAAGVKVSTEHSPSSIGYYSELLFREQKEAGGHPYTVVIPYIEVSDQEAVSQKVTLPLPAIGESRTLDITAEIAGYPVDFTRITRSSETEVNVDIDLKFNPAGAKSLTHFSVSYPGSKEPYSFGWEESEGTPRVMKTLNLITEPGADKLRFILSKPIFIWKGPWTLPLKLED
ncbi:hypothetical protein NST04_01420 [Paenibacillus sp. FSL H7-0756]|uniref:hypothetical protein n=1 Tax=Paenibacillus sp. FSL H7-0756 TaxID=2954738 RepID=UPI0030F9BC9F